MWIHTWEKSDYYWDCCCGSHQWICLLLLLLRLVLVFVGALDSNLVLYTDSSWTIYDDDDDDLILLSYFFQWTGVFEFNVGVLFCSSSGPHFDVTFWFDCDFYTQCVVATKFVWERIGYAFATCIIISSGDPILIPISASSCAWA